MNLKDEIIAKIREALRALGDLPDAAEVRLEYAREEKFGDFACPLALDNRFREAYRRINPEFANPRKFAAALIEKLKEENRSTGFFEKIEIAGPGFINFFLSTDTLFTSVREACREGDRYGWSAGKSRERYIFEFVSANPTGPLNVVSARAAALGDSCCNLLSAAGFDVEREYFVNDYGNQVDLLGLSCLLRHLESRGALLKFSEKSEPEGIRYPSGPGLPFPPEAYHGEYLKEIAAEIADANPALLPPVEVETAAISLSRGENVGHDFPEKLGLTPFAEQFGRQAASYFLETHKRDLQRFRVSFDSFFSERSLHERDAVLGVRNFLREHIYSENGKEVFRSTDFGDDKDRVIVRDDGRPTYLLADIAYHRTKITRDFSYIYNIWGPDHHGYITRLSGAMQAMGFPRDSFRVLIAQQVNLLDEGRPIVMSKRTGRFVTLETLLDEIPVDVARYFFVMRAFESHLDFDFAEARDTSEKNPYYYVAYAHARIRSIFRRAAELDLHPPTDDRWERGVMARLEITPERRRLLRLTSRFPVEIREAAVSMEPQRMTAYLYELAGALSRFYAPRENRIIEQDPETAAALLGLLQATAACLKNGLKLLGMEAPEQMLREEGEATNG